MTAPLRTSAEFVDVYSTTAMRTARVVSQFSDADLNLRPGDGSMSTGEQIQHIVAAARFTEHLIAKESPTLDAFGVACDVSTVSAALNELQSALHAVQSAASTVSPERWGQPCDVFGPQWLKPRGELAFLMAEHEILHCGSLHVYLRVAGKVPHKFYDPVDETVYNHGQSPRN